MVAILLHELLFSNFTGLMYYGSSALFYVAIIMLTAPAAPVTRLVLDIHKICLGSILVNAAGWLLWYFYYPPTIFDLIYFGLHGWVIYALLKQTRVKSRDFKRDWGDINLRFLPDGRTEYLPKYKVSP